MGILMSHVEQLSDTIGPRPAATDAEERTAHYIAEVFEARGLEAQTQAFDTPRSSGGAFAIYHLVTILAAVLSHYSVLPALLLGAASAVVMWLDLDTRWGLTSLMPKGPSQNVIARHVPRSGRNERVTRVLVVAHYDSARTSLATSPGMARNFALTATLTKVASIAIPVLVALRMVLAMLPFGKAVEPWGWYLTLVPAIYLLLPLVLALQGELFSRFSPGANDNASGVAAMLGVFERLVPEPDNAPAPGRVSMRAHVEEPVVDLDLDTEFEMMPADSPLRYSPVAAPARRSESWTDDDDISWDTGVISGQTALGLESKRPEPVAPVKPAADPARVDAEDEASLRLFGAPAYKAPAPAAPAPAAKAPSDFDDLDLDEETAPFDALGQAAPRPATPAQPESPRGGPAGKRVPDSEKHGVRDWLGLGSDFDARAKGRSIGSWDNFDDEDDSSGWKGGSASIEDESDPGYAASVAARIRRKVTMNVDRELSEKEIWFVATGAGETSQAGMKALLAEYGHELHDAVIINIDTVGAGAVSYVTREGAAQLREADRRLVGAARRAVREADLAVKGREYPGCATDATVALARGYRAMSVMAFDINGRLPNWHQPTDTVEGVSESNIAIAVDLVSAIIREL